MKNTTICLLLFLSSFLYAQDKDNFFSKFEISANYGLAGNFFVDYGRDLVRENGIIAPLYSEIFDELQLYQKNFIGTSGGFGITYNFNPKNSLMLSFDRNMNYGKYDGTAVLSNGTPIFIRDFVLRHRNHFYSLAYRRSLNKKNTFFASFGIHYLRDNQADIEIALSENFVVIKERNYQNFGLEEGGFVLGLEKYVYKSGKFEVGIQSKLFITTTSGLETLTLTPVITHKF